MVRLRDLVRSVSCVDWLDGLLSCLNLATGTIHVLMNSLVSDGIGTMHVSFTD